MNQPPSGITANADQPSETKKLIRKLLRGAPKHWKSITAIVSLYASGTAIFGLYVYLSTIERVDLFMPSIAIGPALFAWLFCAMLVLLSVIICIIMPAFIFGGLISLFGLPAKHTAKLGIKFATLMAIGFGLLTLAAFNLDSEKFGLSIPVVWLFAILGLSGIVAFTERQRLKYLAKLTGTKWYRARASGLILFASMIYMLAVLTGIYPAIFISWTHSELTYNQSPVWIGAISIFWMFLLCIPIITFYGSKGSLSKKLSNCIIAAIVVILTFFGMSPSLFGLVAYSAASAVKLRDQKVSEYIISKKYPIGTFDSQLWELKELKDDEKNITIKGFPLFKFGDTLLLCPSRYAGYGRDYVATISKYCFATTKSEVTQAAPTHTIPTFDLREIYCGREFTHPPRALTTKQQCVFASPKSAPQADQK
ncbi:hypothetical protein [Pseudomonas sp. NA-150]|uniref:hypothetical protein n=1 Tax=Pseudomonas sp. NA-150 TaxID=3367525 RepID=UPI0037C5CCA5